MHKTVHNLWLPCWFWIDQLNSLVWEATRVLESIRFYPKMSAVGLHCSWTRLNSPELRDKVIKCRGGCNYKVIFGVNMENDFRGVNANEKFSIKISNQEYKFLSNSTLQFEKKIPINLNQNQK